MSFCFDIRSNLNVQLARLEPFSETIIVFGV